MTKNPTPDYDPSIKGLLDQTESDWGDPVINREGLVPYGIKPFDLALYGLDVYNGELDLILGPKKKRKTTFALNILCNYMTTSKPKIKPFSVVDTLESGMNPKRYRDSLISIMATRILMDGGHRAHTACPVCGTAECREMGVTPEYLRYNTRSRDQQEAIKLAKTIIAGWPLYIYGANPRQGDTRNLEVSMKRWEWLINEKGAKIFIVDHVQQYSFKLETSDYEKQLRAVAAIGDMVAQYNIVCLMLSQVSLTSLREARTNSNVTINATGGTKAQEEANVIFSVGYTPGSGKMTVNIEESRKSDTFSIWQKIEDRSGSFYGEASRAGDDISE